MSDADHATMAAVLEMWNRATTADLAELLAPDYRGHVLGVPTGERDAAAYPATIARYRGAFPDVDFQVVEQLDAGDRLVPGSRRTGPASMAGLRPSARE